MRRRAGSGDAAGLSTSAGGETVGRSRAAAAALPCGEGRRGGGGVIDREWSDCLKSCSRSVGRRPSANRRAARIAKMIDQILEHVAR